jgi:hypothetical protein
MIFSVCGFGAFANLTYGPALIGRKAVGRALRLNDAAVTFERDDLQPCDSDAGSRVSNCRRGIISLIPAALLK